MTAPHLDPHATLEELLDLAGRKFSIEFETVRIGNHSLELLQIANLEDYVDRLAASDKNTIELPFWAKIWPTSILLSYFVQHIDPRTGPDMLELGTGVGLCGLIAAKHGFNVTLSDLEEDALLFCRINIIKNGLQERCKVRRIDFTTDTMDETYDRIIGSEILYMEKSYRRMVKFLLRHLNTGPDAEVVLARDYRLKGKKFFTLAEKEFHIREKLIGYKSSQEDPEHPAPDREKQLSAIYRLKPRKQ